MTIRFKTLILTLSMVLLGLLAGIYLNGSVWLATVGLALIAGLAAYGFSQQIERPLHQINRWVKSVVQQETHDGNSLHLPPAPPLLQGHPQDEIGELALSLQTMGAELEKFIQHLTQTTVAKERMESELRIGRSIQMDMLTLGSSGLPNRQDLAIFATLQPAREVGGDFYDCYFLREQMSYLFGEHRFCFCIGDTSGKGVPAALFTAVMKTLIKSQSYRDLSPANILTHVNQIVSEHNPSCMFTTVFFGVLNLLNGELAYANAGHNPPYLRRRDGSLELLNQRHGPALGIMETISYKENKIFLSTGDLMITYTDGITEAMDAEQNLFSDQRFFELLKSGDYQSPEELVQLTTATVNQFQGDAEQADDITLLAFQYLGIPNTEGELSELAINQTSLSRFKEQWKQ